MEQMQRSGTGEKRQGRQSSQAWTMHQLSFPERSKGFIGVPASLSIARNGILFLRQLIRRACRRGCLRLARAAPSGRLLPWMERRRRALRQPEGRAISGFLHVAAAVRMAAQANNLRSFCNPLAVGAAILCIFRWNGGTGRITALPGVRHGSPSSARSEALPHNGTAIRDAQSKQKDGNETGLILVLMVEPAF